MKTYDELTNDILEKTKTEKARRSRIARRVTALSLALVLAVGGVIAAAIVTRAPGATGEKGVLENADTDGGEKTRAPRAVAASLSTKADYAAIFAYLNASSGEKEKDYHSIVTAPAVNEAADTEAAADSDDVAQKGTVTDRNDDETDHSGTNVQVAGIDEADVVKTDGRYIYAISHRNVYIYEAKDGKMTLVSKAKFFGDEGEVAGAMINGNPAVKNVGTPELYFTDDRLIVIVNASERIKPEADVDYNGDGYIEPYYYNPGQNYFFALIYDISDRSAPSLLTTTGISGSGVSSRMIGDRLYLVASDRYYGIKEDDPETFIPSVYADGDTRLVGSDTVYCGEEKSECLYLNALEIDVEAVKDVSSVSLLGYDGDIMYQSENAIYVAKTDFNEKIETEPGEDDSVTVERYWSEGKTVLTKLTVGEGLAVAASAELEGTLLNSFSMDEYDGYLRVVTSVDKYYSEARWHTQHVTAQDPDDPDMIDAWDYNDEWLSSNDERDRYNDLFVLDSSLAVVGSITRIAPDERIYSCRFEGDQGYFVTYRETDPLFHVDLSDPTNPRIVGELKLPGYSAYLQRYGDYMLGFGVSDEGTLKVSMFSENADGSMNEISKLTIPNALYSEALYDHHAILADASRGIICFGASVYYDDQYEMTVDGDTVTYSYYSGVKYFILTYGEKGFELKGSFDIGEAWPEQMRGLYIGDYFYVYQEGQQKSAVTSLNFDSFEVADAVTMDSPEDYVYGFENSWICVDYAK